MEVASDGKRRRNGPSMAQTESHFNNPTFKNEIGDQAADQEPGGRGRDTGKKPQNVTETLIWRTLVAEKV